MSQLQAPDSTRTTDLDHRAARRDAVRSCFSGEGVDALLVSRDCDIAYLTGFCGHDSWLVLDENTGTVISDSRYDEQLNPVRESGAADVIMGTRHRLHEALAEYCSQRGIGRLGIQADHLAVSVHKIIDGSIGASIIDTDGVVAARRVVKDAGEIAAIEHAISINESALRVTLPQLHLGMTEREISALLEFEMKRHGGDGAGFTPIVAVGSSGSLPHYETGNVELVDGTSLLIDWGTTVDGYQSDLTRTFGISTMPPPIAEIYQIVLEAQLAAITATGPGRICADLDAVARDVITRAGYGDYFGHGLGHGMGIEVHEAPYFNQLETETELVPGMVMTVEPGIYLPGVGGVRIEDNIVITEDGCRVLSSFSKSLDEAVLTPSQEHAA